MKVLELVVLLGHLLPLGGAFDSKSDENSEKFPRSYHNKSCPEPPVVKGGYVQSTLYKRAKDKTTILVTYTCSPGTELLGSPTLSCVEGTDLAKVSNWTGPAPSCHTFPKTPSAIRGITQENKTSGGLRGPQCIAEAHLHEAHLPHTSCLPDSPYLVYTESFPVNLVLVELNKVRKEYTPLAKEMPMLQWSDDLAITAERWAAQCPNHIGHDSFVSRQTQKFKRVSQSLCWPPRKRGRISWKRCIAAWAREARYWKYGIGQTSPSAVVGDFTQIIWANTTHVGCGRARCRGSNRKSYILVCNYAPGGNWAPDGQNPYAHPYISI